ncbi:hypothetical protein PVAND_005700 [Polypedilum vanderplanki]|uniref:Uncharacterized protein n=1 Tax=Polypedilum vanderplanki TaxID=319348 RepID=A0A9J6C2U8_POLVA|nr:hypothetical protein PVAND_005700 [Polypedilum vanderplanki]
MEAESVEVVEAPKPKTYLKVSLSNAELPKVDYCCFLFDLRIGLSIWLIIEAIIWTFLFVAALYHEIVYASAFDLFDFSDETKGWYHYLLLGDESIESDHKIRTYTILFNFMLMLIFLSYLIFCLVLLIGINMRKTCFFLPYFTLDIIFSLIAFIGCFVGLILSYNHLFRMSFIFLLIKTYVEICTVSMFLKIRREKSKASSTSDTSGTIYQDNQATAV